MGLKYNILSNASIKFELKNISPLEAEEETGEEEGEGAGFFSDQLENSSANLLSVALDIVF